MSRRSLLVPAAVILAAVAAPAARADQYEATLLPERSLRYRTSFGLFEDDFDAFVRPRYLTRWDGDRFATHLANLAPEGEAAVGYGRAVTDGWSWSLLAGGGYASESAYRSEQNVFAAGAGPTSAHVRNASAPEGTPNARGSASAAFGAARQAGPGQLGLGLQARWISRSERSLPEAPLLFTLPSPEAGAASGGSTVTDLDTGELFEAEGYRREPESESRSLRAVAVAGYGVRKETGWGWSVDLLGGVEQIARKDALEARAASQAAEGSAVRTYATRTDIGGTAPLAGLALTLHRAGAKPIWIDLGGEYAFGAGVDGDRGRTTGGREVVISTGGLQRTYTLAETREDRFTGSLGKRLLATAGLRQSMALDPLLQLGWGVHATYQKSDDDLDVISHYDIEETLDLTNEGRGGDVRRAAAEGQSRERRTASLQRVRATLPVALLIRSTTDAALEWRLGSEIRYQNTLARSETAVDSVVLPSGLLVDPDLSSAPLRYTGTIIPGGKAAESRRVSLNAAVHAGAGYWFTPTAKVDVLVAARPAGDGFLDFDDRSVALSALLAF